MLSTDIFSTKYNFSYRFIVNVLYQIEEVSSISMSLRVLTVMAVEF